MKIVQIITRSDNVGGAQVYLKDLSVALQAQGHSIDIIVGGMGPFFVEMKECGVPIHSLHHLIRPIHPYHDIMAFWELRSLLRSLKPTIVVTHTSKAGWLGRMAAWSLAIPTIFTAHGWSFIQVAPRILARFYILAEKIAGLLTNKVITVSEYDRKFCLKHGMLPSSKVITVQNGIPDIRYTIANQCTDSPLFIMTARLEKPKNHLFLLDALAPLRDLDWQLYLVGDGPMRNKIEECVYQLQLTEKVHLLGARRDVPELLSKAQGFILCSDMEGLPLSILEAMRAGLPIIASDVGGISEIVEEGANGFLIAKNQTEVLSSRLRTLICDWKLRQQMGAASREKYHKNFRLDHMVDKTLAIYLNVSCTAYKH